LTLKPSKKKSVGIGTGFFDSIDQKGTSAIAPFHRTILQANLERAVRVMDG
jgi:hypothetical protein